MTDPVVVTGIGVVSPNGTGATAYTEALRRGASGVKMISGFDTSKLKIRFAGEVADFNPADHMDPRDLRRISRTVPLAVAAAREALTMAGITHPMNDIAESENVGVLLGTGGGGQDFVENQYRIHYTGVGKSSPFTVPAGTPGNLSSEISIALGLRGLSHVITSGCASSTDAIGYATMHLNSGRLPMMLVGGSDAPLAEGIMLGFEAMRILASPCDPVSASSRPFHAGRNGFVLGEGAWMLVLEKESHALSRGAKPLAEIRGWGSTCDAYHRVQPSPDSTQSARAIRLAIAQAGITAEQIEYVNLHGTGTRLNDVLETQTMKRSLGDHARAIPMSTVKSMIGHPQGACGAAGVAATILSLRAGFIHPTINLDRPDPECDLDYVPHQSRPTEAQWALCNCIAFGSKNSALVVRVRRD
jgi:3-oxoacyl-[acyl-carrier-protein] synthase II